MIERNLSEKLKELAGYYPVVTVTGPRQSGKTTLCRMTFPDRPYVSLEPMDMRQYARNDPRGLLADYADGAIIDEVQHAPELLGYLQTDVDERPDPGRFILTGSQHFGLAEAISQSLAGRTGVLFLLPCSWDELQRFDDPPADLMTALFMGAYPRIHDHGIPAERWLADYVATYVQRDVRQVLKVMDLEAFTTFLGLVAGRTAQVVNLSALGGDAGVTHNTARSWLSVLETGFLAHRLPAWHRNVRRQLTRAPKLHVLDSGLACRLLGIRSPDELRNHPLRGALFESWVVSEVLKARFNQGLDPSLRYFREQRGLEVDLVLETADRVLIAECKSGSTVASDFFSPLDRLGALLEAWGETRPVEGRVVFGGEESQARTAGRVVPWNRICDTDWS